MRWGWALLQDGNIAVLRKGNGVLVCSYIMVNGSDNNRTMTIVKLYGVPIDNDWTLRCDVSSYVAIPNFTTQPYCTTSTGAYMYNASVVSELSITH
jgi:hypothetical protein